MSVVFLPRRCSDSSHLYETIGRHTKDHGIAVSGLSLDLPSMMLRKDKVVRTLTQGIAGLFKKNNVAWLAGRARLLGDMRVSVTERTRAEASVDHGLAYHHRHRFGTRRTARHRHR